MASPKNILVIERNDSHYELVCQSLMQGPLATKLTRATNVENGRRLLNRNQYDLIVTENGHLSDEQDWILDLKKRAHGAPVVVLTSTADQKKAITAMKMGADDYIIKNRDILKTLPQALAKTIEIHKKKKVGGGINLLAKNLKTITHFINQPSAGFAHGKKQIKKLEREIKHIKGMLKNLVS